MPSIPACDRQLPTSLKVIAWLYIAAGLLSVVVMAWHLLHGKFAFRIGVIGLWIGPELLGCDKDGWNWAIVYSCFGLLASAYVSISTGQIFPALFAAYFLWQLFVLGNRDVRDLFGQPASDST